MATQVSIGQTITEHLSYSDYTIPNAGISINLDHQMLAVVVPQGVSSDITTVAKPVTSGTPINCGGYTIPLLVKYDAFEQDVALTFTELGSKTVSFERRLYGREYTCGTAFVLRENQITTQEYEVVAISVSTVSTTPASSTAAATIVLRVRNFDTTDLPFKPDNNIVEFVSGSRHDSEAVSAMPPGLVTTITSVSTIGGTPVAPNAEGEYIISPGASDDDPVNVLFSLGITVTDETPAGVYTLRFASTLPSGGIGQFDLTVNEDQIALAADRTAFPHPSASQSTLQRGQWDTTNHLPPATDDSNLGLGATSRIVTFTLTNSGNVPGSVRMSVSGPALARWRTGTSGIWLDTCPTVTVQPDSSAYLYGVFGRALIGSGTIQVHNEIGEGTPITLTISTSSSEPLIPELDAITAMYSRTKGGPAIEFDEYVRKDQIKGRKGISVQSDEDSLEVWIEGDASGSSLTPTHVKFVDAGWQEFLDPSYTDTYNVDLVLTGRYFYSIQAAIDSVLSEPDYPAREYMIVIYPHAYALTAPIQFRNRLHFYVCAGTVLSYTSTPAAPFMLIDQNVSVSSRFLGEASIRVTTTETAGGVLKIDNAGSTLVMRAREVTISDPDSTQAPYTVDTASTVSSELGSWLNGAMDIQAERWAGNIYLKGGTLNRIDLYECTGGIRITTDGSAAGPTNATIDVERHFGDLYIAGSNRADIRLGSDGFVRRIIVTGSITASIACAYADSLYVTGTAICNINVYSSRAVLAASVPPAVLPAFPTMPAEVQTPTDRRLSLWQIVVTGDSALIGDVAAGVDYIKTGGTTRCDCTIGGPVRWLYVVQTCEPRLACREVDYCLIIRPPSLQDATMFLQADMIATLTANEGDDT